MKAGLDIEEDDFGDVVKGMENSDLKRGIEEMKIEIFRLEG